MSRTVCNPQVTNRAQLCKEKKGKKERKKRHVECLHAINLAELASFATWSDRSPPPSFIVLCPSLHYLFFLLSPLPPLPPPHRHQSTPTPPPRPRVIPTHTIECIHPSCLEDTDWTNQLTMAQTGYRGNSSSQRLVTKGRIRGGTYTRMQHAHSVCFINAD